MLRKWEELPDFMRCDEVKEYYDILKKKRVSLFIKRVFDVFVALIAVLVLGIFMIAIAIIIKIDSKGPILFKKERVTSYGKIFKIHKFRTMVKDADKNGSSVTVNKDARVTRVGRVLRKFRMDEFPQLFDVLAGNMSFVGTRPEDPKYVKQYTKEMNATLLLPAGITSETSIKFKDEEKLLSETDDVDKTYVEVILPEKMKYNLESIRNFGFVKELSTMIKTAIAVFK